MSDMELMDIISKIINIPYKFMKACEFHVFGVDFTLWQLFLVGLLLGVCFWAWWELTD